MKFILSAVCAAIIGSLVIVGIAYSADKFIPQNNSCIYRSSFTRSNDTTKYIADSRYLKSIVISSASANGFLYVYDSTFTAAGQVLPAIRLDTIQMLDVNLFMQQGITYSITGNDNGVAIIYRKKN